MVASGEKMHIQCTYGQPAAWPPPPPRDTADEMPKKVKITEAVRAAMLRRMGGKLVPDVAHDTEIRRFALIIKTERAFWALFFQPQGVNPATGKRWGGGKRVELGDAFAMSIADARAAALASKALVRQGRDPLREAMASRASAVAERKVLPTTLAEALDAYEKALMARRQPAEATRRQAVAYARKACRLMQVDLLALSTIGEGAVRLLVETMPGSDGERRHVFGGLNKFLTWCRRQGLIQYNPCDALGRDERPKPGKARDNVPSLSVLRGVWGAVAPEFQRDLVRLLLLVPLRRDEAAGLRWSEVDLEGRRIFIGPDRMKNKQGHELPLAEQALAILTARRPVNAKKDYLVFPSGEGKTYDGWNRLATRIRKRIGQAEAAKHQAFSFHDIRRAFVSHLAGRFDVDLLDQCLSHTRKGVLGIYQRSSRMPERAEAMRAWGGLICGEQPLAMSCRFVAC
jgi:integrase